MDSCSNRSASSASLSSSTCRAAVRPGGGVGRVGGLGRVDRSGTQRLGDCGKDGLGRLDPGEPRRKRGHADASEGSWACGHGPHGGDVSRSSPEPPPSSPGSSGGGTRLSPPGRAGERFLADPSPLLPLQTCRQPAAGDSSATCGRVAHEGVLQLQQPGPGVGSHAASRPRSPSSASSWPTVDRTTQDHDSSDVNPQSGRGTARRHAARCRTRDAHSIRRSLAGMGARSGWISSTVEVARIHSAQTGTQ